MRASSSVCGADPDKCRETAPVHAFWVGFGLGFVVALQLGPVSLYQIRTTLRNGLAVGLAFAAGIALVDLAYAALGAAGVAPLLTIGPLETILGLLGAAVLAFLGVRTLRSAFRVRLGAAAPAMSSKRAFGVALSMTAANPLTIASWAAIFSAASAAGATSSFSGAVLLVVGVGLGSATWDVTLATATALVGRYVGERFLRAVDLVAGIALLFFGGVLAYSVVT
jgi:putative LysE/RhtB family amino acid efflux pump